MRKFKNLILILALSICCLSGCSKDDPIAESAKSAAAEIQEMLDKGNEYYANNIQGFKNLAQFGDTSGFTAAEGFEYGAFGSVAYESYAVITADMAYDWTDETYKLFMTGYVQDKRVLITEVYFNNAFEITYLSNILSPTIYTPPDNGSGTVIDDGTQHNEMVVITTTPAYTFNFDTEAPESTDSSSITTTEPVTESTTTTTTTVNTDNEVIENTATEDFNPFDADIWG